MIVKYLASIALAALLLVAGGAMPVAQGRRGGGPPAEAKTGTIEHIVVHGKALEGNLEGDSPDRDVTVYLPPSYAGNPTRRYPVVYLLHGYGGRDTTFTERLANLLESADRLATAQGFSESIVVTPNASPCTKAACTRTR
jgi:S-formylglutathione hydrolase FrmB